jgi:hypothetical protein
MPPSHFFLKNKKNPKKKEKAKKKYKYMLGWLATP